MKSDIRRQGIVIQFWRAVEASRITFLMGTLAATMVIACSRSGGDTPRPISSDSAIAIARERVVADGVMSLEAREPIVTEEGQLWHVRFLRKGTNLVAGGEPHVMVRKSDGAVVRVYYTQ